MVHLSVSELRDNLSTTVSRVCFAKERVIVQRQGKDLVAIVPLDDIELLEEAEDRWLVEEAEKALADPANQKRIPWDEVKAKLGL